MNHTARRQSTEIRSGFTILELLIVITVIALLMSLLLGAAYRFVVSARETATAATVMKAGGIIDDRVAAFRNSDFSDTAYSASTTLAGGVTTDLADIYMRKRRFRFAFPQTFKELYPGLKSQLFGTATVPPTNPEYSPRYEPGIMLYAVLMHGTTFGAATPGDDAFTGQEVINSLATGGLPCLVDAWGEPLRFYRWPTRLIKCGENGLGDYNLNGSTSDPAGTINLSTGLLQASPAIRPTGNLLSPTPASLLFSKLAPFDINSAYSRGADGSPGFGAGTALEQTLGWPDSDDPEFLNQDPDDPMMQLTGLFGTASNAISFVVGSQLDKATNTFFVDALHDPFTFSAPLIVSSGQDKKLGLFEPSDIPTATNPKSIAFGYLAAPTAFPGCLSDLADNITNRNQQPGGKR